MAFLPAAALIFERNDMPLAREELRLRVPEGSIASQFAKDGPWTLGAWDAQGIPRTEAISQRLVAVVCAR